MSGLVLSTFPGLGLLDMAFELEGFCVVRAPDLLWGGDIRRFHPPAGKFDGIIGGPPCQTHSTMRHLSLVGNGVAGGEKHGDMIPEFVRVVSEARPAWFVMENVPGAPIPVIGGYEVQSYALNNRWFGAAQNRLRVISLGSPLSRPAFPAELAAQMPVFENQEWEHAVLAGHGPAAGRVHRGIKGRDWKEAARVQGVPAEVIATLAADSPFTTQALKKMIGNGVPLPLGCAVARAVKRAMENQERAA